jgi:hypothetical protein
VNIEELETIVDRLRADVRGQAGIIAAHQVSINALIATLGVHLPHAVNTFAHHLQGMKDFSRQELSTSAIAEFDTSIANTLYAVKLLQG